MGKTIKQLEAELEAIKTERRQLNFAITLRKNEHTEKLVRPLEVQLASAKAQVSILIGDEFNTAMDDLSNRIGAAEVALRNAKVQAASSNPLIGKVYCRWEGGRFSRDVLKNTGERAVVEVYDGNTDIQFGRYIQAIVGGLYLRNLRKDGTPGVKAVGRIDSDSSGSPGWHPEGVNPNVKEAAK